MKDNEELRKLIESNPDLPLVFLVGYDDMYEDYGYTVFQSSDCFVSEVYFDGDHYSAHEEDIIEDYRDKLCDKEEYKDLSDDEYDEAVKKYINENIEHYKAIVVEIY